MISRFPLVSTLFLLLTASATAQLLPSGITPGESEHVPGVQGRVLVKLTREAHDRLALNGQVPLDAFGSATQRFGMTEARQWMSQKLLDRAMPVFFKRKANREYPAESVGRIVEIHYTSSDDPWTVVEALEKMKGVVEYAEPVYPRHLFFTPSDPHHTSQWYLEKISAYAGWDVQRADSTMIIGVIDGGVDLDHPDLQDAIWVNPGESGNGRENNNIDDDGNGFVDDVKGWDFFGSGPNGQDNDVTDYYGHGTHSAGCAAGIGNNAKGIAGVAWGSRLMIVKVTDDNAFDPDIHNEMQGVLYAATMGAKVINMSFGGTGRSRAEQEIINLVRNRYDPVLVAAAGNYSNEFLNYPADYDGIISVAATNNADAPSDFTNYNYLVDISAPGTDIWSTDIGDSYSYDSGTSFASPITAGGAALVRMKYPTWSAQQVEEALRATSFDIRSTLSLAMANKMGAGRLDLQAALEQGGTVASARVLSFTVDEDVHDSAYMPGEHVRIRAKVSNILAAAPNVTVTIAGDGNGVVFDNIISDMGAMAAGESRFTGETVFGFTVPADAQPNSILHFLVTVTTTSPDQHVRNIVEAINVPVARSWATTDVNDIKLTFTSAGGVGFLGIGANARQGDGLAFIPRDGSVQGLPAYNLLYHGGLMIGTDASHVSATVRRGLPSMGVDTGFAPRVFYTLATSGDSSIQTGTARFDDMNRPSNQRVGIDVTMTTEERRQSPMNSVVLVRYKLHNVSGTTLQNLHCGLFLDWDVGFAAVDDTAGYDIGRRFAWQQSNSLPHDITVGAALLSNQSPRYSAIDFSIDNADLDFPDSMRWRFLSTEFATTTEPSDLGMVMGAGGMTLAPDEETTVIFAIGVARTLDQLRAGIDALQATVGAPLTPTLPATLGLSVLPNPLPDAGEIRFTLPGTVETTLGLYRPDGVEVVLPIDHATLDAGEHTVRLSRGNLPAGAYLLRLRAGARTVQKLVIIE